MVGCPPTASTAEFDVWFADKLVDLVTGLGGSRDRTTTTSFGTSLFLVTRAELEVMARTDWLARKIIDIVPQDMVRAGRRWKTTADNIGAIEELERSPTVNLWVKLREAMCRARLTGGSAIYIGVEGADPSRPLDPTALSVGSLAYLTVIDRMDLSFAEMDLDPQSSNYGRPKMWHWSSGSSVVDIHPTRMVVFSGPQVFSARAGSQDMVWGDSVLQIVYDAVRNAASVQQHIAALVPDSRNDVIYIPGLGKLLENPTDTQKLTTRFQFAATVKSMFNMVLLEGNGAGGDRARGERWEQRSVSFSHLPELMRQYLQIAAGAADIPVTRLLGESPAGENATGESDLRNYYDHVASLQKLSLSPALHVLDRVILASALGPQVLGDRSIFYEWAPLWSLSETEKSEIFERKAKAVRDLAGNSPTDKPLVNLHALSDSVVNMATEDGSLPGLEAAVAKHGTLAETMPDIHVESPEPSALTPVTATDAAPRPLYVRRQLLNTSEFVRWASDQGIRGIIPSDELHVTVLFSKEPVDWLKMGTDHVGSDQKGRLTVPAGGPRIVEQLGPTATVLSFSSAWLSWRHMQMRELGASSDYDEYVAHVTISHEPQEIDLSRVDPFRGELRFGPEIFEEIDLDWKEKILAKTQER